MNAKLILFLSCFAAVTLAASVVNAGPRGGGGMGRGGGHFSSMSARGGNTFARGPGTWSGRNWSGRNWNGRNWNGRNWNNWSGNWRHHHHNNNNDVIFIGGFGFPFWGWGYPYGYGYGYPYGYGYGYGYPYGYGYDYNYYGDSGYGAAPIGSGGLLPRFYRWNHGTTNATRDSRVRTQPRVRHDQSLLVSGGQSACNPAFDCRSFGWLTGGLAGRRGRAAGCLITAQSTQAEAAWLRVSSRSLAGFFSWFFLRRPCRCCRRSVAVGFLGNG